MFIELLARLCWLSAINGIYCTENGARVALWSRSHILYRSCLHCNKSCHHVFIYCLSPRYYFDSFKFNSFMFSCQGLGQHFNQSCVCVNIDVLGLFCSLGQCPEYYGMQLPMGYNTHGTDFYLMSFSCDSFFLNNISCLMKSSPSLKGI